MDLRLKATSTVEGPVHHERYNALVSMNTVWKGDRNETTCSLFGDLDMSTVWHMKNTASGKRAKGLLCV